MNIRAKCVNAKCPAYGIEKSVAVGQMLGYGTKNDRVKCPSCGELMQTTESMNTSSGKATRKSVGRTIVRRPTTRKRITKRVTKREYKRGSGKRS
jgi:predicted RNA-binding Zn-ribbon protein involved in translation (DUF1610 family)